MDGNLLSIPTNNILPVTTARGRLGDLVEKTNRNTYFVLTKGGLPKAAIVDIEYLTRIQEMVGKFLQKTYINEKFLPYTRLFDKGEIDEWLTNDKI